MASSEDSAVERRVGHWLGLLQNFEPVVRQRAVELVRRHGATTDEELAQLAFLAALSWEFEEPGPSEGERPYGVSKRLDDYCIRLCERASLRGLANDNLMSMLRKRIKTALNACATGQAVDKRFLESLESLALFSKPSRGRAASRARIEMTPLWPTVFEAPSPLPPRHVLRAFAMSESQGDLDLQEFLWSGRQEKSSLLAPDAMGNAGPVDLLTLMLWRYRGVDGLAPKAPKADAIATELRGAGVTHNRRSAKPSPTCAKSVLTGATINVVLSRAKSEGWCKLLLAAQQGGKLKDLDSRKLFCAVTAYERGKLILRTEGEQHGQ